MATYKEIIRVFNDAITKINTHLHTLNKDERLQVWGMTDDNILPTFVNNATISNVRSSVLHLDIDSTSHSYLTIKDFDLTIRQEVNGGDDIYASKYLATELDELYQSILARSPKKAMTPSEILGRWETLFALVESSRDKESVEDSLPIEILHHWEKLLAELNRVAHGYNWDEVVESNTCTIDSFINRTFSIGINSDFKIVFVANEPDTRGKPIASVQVKRFNEDCKRSLIEGYLEGITTMTRLIANVKSKISSF